MAVLATGWRIWPAVRYEGLRPKTVPCVFAVLLRSRKPKQHTAINDDSPKPKKRGKQPKTPKTKKKKKTKTPKKTKPKKSKKTKPKKTKKPKKPLFHYPSRKALEIYTNGRVLK